MRAVAQRVTSAEVEVEGEIVGRIGPGLLVFHDDAGKMSRAVAEIGGGVLVVPQFTLFGDVRRGKRPSFDDAAPPDEGRLRYEEVIARLRAAGLPVETGRFRA